jgi:hypothetical protein
MVTPQIIFKKAVVVLGDGRKLGWEDRKMACVAPK